MSSAIPADAAPNHEHWHRQDPALQRASTAATTSDSNASSAATTLIAFLRGRADEIDPASRAIREGWRYPSLYHLLLDTGRLFTPAPLPPDVDRLGEQFCFANAVQTIGGHPGMGLVYVEGYGTCSIDATYLHVPHAWAAGAGAAIDPTWPDNPEGAYLGIPFADPGRWPHALHGGGILQEIRSLLPILREGLPEDCTADIGRPLPSPEDGQSHCAHRHVPSNYRRSGQNAPATPEPTLSPGQRPRSTR